MFVVLFQVLTLAVTPLVWPVMISLNTNVPVDVREGSENVILTTSDVVYPEPALVNPKKVTIPALLISATAVAVVPTPVGPEMVTVGLVVNPPPWLVNVTTPNVPSPVNEVAAAPAPSDPPPKNLIPGPWVYPAPGLVIGTDWIETRLELTFLLQYAIPPIVLTVAIPVWYGIILFAVGAELIATVGFSLYPPPLFVSVIVLKPPCSMTLVYAAAVTPVPTIVRVWVGPWIVLIPSSVVPSVSSPVSSLSISLIPVAITSSS